MKTNRQPVIYVSHGAPTLPLEHTPASDFLRGLGRTLGKPRAILVVSAHWETAQPMVSGAQSPETIHDFYGFPPELYKLRYSAPGAPQLADRVSKLLGHAGMPTQIDANRGLDHGAWTPLLLMYPEADIPVTQLSVQTALGPQHHLQLGAALNPLREEGVMILASGSVTHNLGEFRNYRGAAEPPAWVSEFNEWLARHLLDGRFGELAEYKSVAPSAKRNHPTEEHLLPLFVAAGAATPGTRAERLHASYAFGVIGMDAYKFS